MFVLSSLVIRLELFPKARLQKMFTVVSVHLVYPMHGLLHSEQHKDPDYDQQYQHQHQESDTSW
jgi:hypothetical protein